MRKVIFIHFVLGFSAFANLFAASNEPLATFHFVGSTALAGDPNAARLKRIWVLPETVTLRKGVAEKLARASLKIFGSNPADQNAVALLHPLFEDLVAGESFAELRQNAGLEFLLAVQLSQPRSLVWETNLLQLLNTKTSPFKMDAASGWQAKIKGGTNVLKFTRAGKWTFVLFTREQSAAASDFLKRVEKINPDKNWFEANVDWPRLRPWLPLDFSPFKIARTEIKIGGRGGDDLRTTMRAIYPEKINWKSAQWKTPTNLIRDPLISFSAAQNPAPFFKPSVSLLQLKASSPLTNQLFFWALSQMPFLSYAALPVNDASNTAKMLAPELATTFNGQLQRRDGGRFEVASNGVDVFWKGLPIIVPFLNPVKLTNGQDILLAGLFPLVASTNTPPAELFRQITGRNDLVFYDWEITEIRLSQWQGLSQMFPFFSREFFISKNAGQKKYLPAKVPEQPWLQAIAPLLGNTITEVTFKAPNELNVVRKSHMGLNSLELILLSHWLAHPNFPSVNPFATVQGAEAVSGPATNSPQKKP